MSWLMNFDISGSLNFCYSRIPNWGILFSQQGASMPALKSHRVRFDDFVADLSSGELFKDGAKVQLQDKPFQILSLFLQKPKELISRQEIISKVWTDTFVEGDLCLNVAIRRLRAALSDKAADAKFIETVGSHGYRFLTNVNRPNASEVPVSNHDHPRIAVFPLRSELGVDVDSFAASMTELIIVALRHAHPQLSVITPEFTTERARRGKLSLCREVSAGYMLVGAVSQSDGQIRIIVKLLKCRAQACIWAESYVQPKEDLFANQAAVSRKIASSIVQAIPVSVHPSHLEKIPSNVYESYLLGCSLRSRLSEDALGRCIPILEGAVHECPQFALAWTALANAHCMLARLGVAPSREVFPVVKRCVDKAFAIEDLDEARTALAYYQFFYEHDWEAAEANLLRTLASDARSPLAVGGYAQLLTSLGRHEEAVFLMQQACSLDPFAGYSAIMFGWALYYAGNYTASLTQLRKAMGLDPSLWIGHTSAGMVLERLGEMEAAVAEFRQALEQSDNSSLARAHLAFGLARMGDRSAATEALQKLLQLRKKHYFSPYWIAVIYVALNQPSDALAWLEIAAKERCGWVVFARVDPKLAVLHSDPRFHRLLSGINPARRAVFPA
jgi:DNA-binding winged helix-turn-helix (wHTH) protein/tetratricopeptide (TPR) repeat protein